MARNVTGVIWIGPIFNSGGYGNVSRNFLMGFRRIGFPVQAINFGADERRLLDLQILNEINELTEADPGPYPIVVVHYGPDLYPLIQGKNIVAKCGYTIFETDRIPKYWVGLCNNMDEIWVPSHFNFQTFENSGVLPEKINVFPYGINTEFFKPSGKKVSIEGGKKFCFLYVSYFDYRKGFDLLLEAYLKEFNSQEDVSLIIKTGVSHSEESPTDVRNVILGLVEEKIDLARKDLPHFDIVTEAVHQQQLQKFYDTCDLYISTDRANGWGMPCMEAMAIGKPAATIDWSGSTEFMNEHNSLLIKPTGRLVPVDERLANARPIYKEHQWAEVEVNEVRRVMRYAYENQDVLSKIGDNGTKDIRENYSLIKAASRIRDHLLSIEVPTHLNGSPQVRILETVEPSLVEPSLEEALHRKELELQQMEAALHSEELERQQMEAKLRDILRSRSWRMTAPLRSANLVVKRFRRMIRTMTNMCIW